MKQSNGNDKLNQAREDHNNKVSKLKGLGNTKGFVWKKNRRNTNI